MAKKQKKQLVVDYSFPANFVGSVRLQTDSQSGSLTIISDTGDQLEIWRSSYETVEQAAAQKQFLTELAECARKLAKHTFAKV